MIPQIRLPPRMLTECRSAFGLGREARQLRVVVDLDSFDAGLEVKLLLGFAAHPDVALTTLRLSQAVLDTSGGAVITSTSDAGSEQTYLTAVANHVAAARNILARVPADPQWTKRNALLCFAELKGADAFVTASTDLLDLARVGVNRSNTMAVAHALALVGLFLRHRSDFTYACGEGFEKSLTRNSHYNVHATLLVPNIGRWMTRCPLTVEGSRRRPRALADAIVTRLGRALRARDSLIAHLLMDSGYEPPDDAFLHLDTLLVALRGGFDAAAGVTATAHAPQADVTHVGWAEKRWCRTVGELAPALQPLLVEGGLVRDAYHLANFLREFIHAEPLEPIFQVDGPDVNSGALLLPATDKLETFLQCARRQGGLAAWGIENLDARTYMFGVHTFTERVVPWAAAALDALCKHVGVESFGVGTADDEQAWAVDTAQRAGGSMIPVALLGGVGPRPAPP